jgi:hypothetical protein
MSGCDKSLRHGRPANAVVEDKAPHSLTSNTSNASAPEPSNTPNPTPEPSKSVQPLSDTADTGNSVAKVSFCIVVLAKNLLCLRWFNNTGISSAKISLCVFAPAFIYGGYKLLYKFASFKPVLIDKLCIVEKKDITEDYKQCYFDNYHFFDCASKEYIDEIPVRVEIQLPNFLRPQYYYYYQPNPSKRKPLLRKMFGIETPVPSYSYFGALVPLGAWNARER